MFTEIVLRLYAEVILCNDSKLFAIRPVEKLKLSLIKQFAVEGVVKEIRFDDLKLGFVSAPIKEGDSLYHFRYAVEILCTIVGFSVYFISEF